MRNKYCFPKVIRIEPSSICNLHCRHCDTGLSGRSISRGKINIDLFNKILREIKPRVNEVSAIVMYHGGEPLINSEIYSMISMLKKCGIKKVKMNSNGMLINKYSARKLIFSGLDVLYISIDGRNPSENDNQIRIGSKYNTVRDNVVMIAELKKMIGLHTPELVISNTRILEHGVEYSDMNSPRIPEFLIEDFGRYNIPIQTYNAIVWPGVSSMINDYFNVRTISDKQTKFFCENLDETMTIRYNGKVVPCCFDIHGNYIFGDVVHDTIEKIWNSDPRQELISMIKSGNPHDMCIGCKNLGYEKYLEYKK